MPHISDMLFYTRVSDLPRCRLGFSLQDTPVPMKHEDRRFCAGAVRARGPLTDGVARDMHHGGQSSSSPQVTRAPPFWDTRWHSFSAIESRYCQGCLGRRENLTRERNLFFSFLPTCPGVKRAKKGGAGGPWNQQTHTPPPSSGQVPLPTRVGDLPSSESRRGWLRSMTSPIAPLGGGVQGIYPSIALR